jgi:nicotinate phosphoribosyltransferase
MIAALAVAPVDTYGVGTSLVTGSGHPTAGFVYKLVAHSDGENWTEVAKASKQKTNRGGKKLATRLVEDSVARAELISEQKSPGRNLQVPLISNGELHSQYLGAQGVELARNHHRAAMAELPASALRLSKGDPAIPVEFI